MNKKRIFKLAAAAIAVVILAAAGVFAAFDHYGALLSSSDIEDLPQLEKPLADRINFLIIGSDKGGANTDVLMFVSYDKADNKIKITSIPRDTRALVNGKNRKINACLAIGRDELLLGTIKDITGAPIHYYVKVDLQGFKSIVDILDGVDFYVPRDMKYSDPSQNLYINLKEGMQHLDGDKAEQLVRFRRYVQGDLERIKVQREFVTALIQQNLTPSVIVKAPALYSEISKYVKTNFTASDLVKNLGIFDLLTEESDENRIEVFELPGVAKNLNGVSYYLHDVEKTLALFAEEFGGTGESSASEEYKKANAADLSAKAPTPAPKPTPEPSPAPLPEPTPEPTAEPSPAPSPEPMPGLSPEPSPAPMPGLSPEPSPAPVSEPEPESIADPAP